MVGAIMDIDQQETDESLTLSGSTLAALEEFYANRDARQKQFEDMKVDSPQPRELTMDAFAENWNESQFWYSEYTATLLAKQLLSGSNKTTTIAVVSAPSVFVQLQKELSASGVADTDKPKIYLLEFDQRFNVFPEFVYYDFQAPLKLPADLKGAVDHIICDPPFLSEDCQTKAALTVRWLSKSQSSPTLITNTKEENAAQSTSSSKLIVCTGERMTQLVTKLYRQQGIATTTFEPVHERGLSNEFYCFANFECDTWKWRN